MITLSSTNLGNKTQTDEIEAKTQVFDLDDATMANLAEFLGRVEPVVAQVLDMNSRSLSFDGRFLVKDCFHVSYNDFLFKRINLYLIIENKMNQQFYFEEKKS